MDRDQKRRVLIVDDERAIRMMLARMMQRLGFEPLTAGNGEEALACIQPDIDLVLLDVNMPGMRGFEVVERIRAMPAVSQVPVLLVTTLTGREDRLRAVEAGVDDFIAKPVDLVELQVRTDAVMRLRDAQDQLKRHNELLETEVEARTRELSLALNDMEAARDHLEAAQVETLHRLAIASEFKDQYSTMHIRRVGRFCAIVARTLGLSEPSVQLVLRASPLHDVGKLGIPDAILLKPGRLTDEERSIVQRHTVIGARILGGSSSEILRTAESIALTHHEHFDGGGYPQGIAGEEIPIFGRICAVADVYDALTSRRPYKKPFSSEKAIGILEKGRGSQFDPRILEAFLSRRQEIEEVRRALKDRETINELRAVPLPRPANGPEQPPDSESKVV